MSPTSLLHPFLVCLSCVLITAFVSVGGGSGAKGTGQGLRAIRRGPGAGSGLGERNSNQADRIHLGSYQPTFNQRLNGQLLDIPSDTPLIK